VLVNFIWLISTFKTPIVEVMTTLNMKVADFWM
jgi:hypothetical protein